MSYVTQPVVVAAIQGSTYTPSHKKSKAQLKFQCLLNLKRQLISRSCCSGLFHANQSKIGRVENRYLSQQSKNIIKTLKEHLSSTTNKLPITKVENSGGVQIAVFSRLYIPSQYTSTVCGKIEATLQSTEVSTYHSCYPLTVNA